MEAREGAGVLVDGREGMRQRGRAAVHRARTPRRAAMGQGAHLWQSRSEPRCAPTLQASCDTAQFHQPAAWLREPGESRCQLNFLLPWPPSPSLNILLAVIELCLHNPVPVALRARAATNRTQLFRTGRAGDSAGCRRGCKCMHKSRGSIGIRLSKSRARRQHVPAAFFFEEHAVGLSLALVRTSHRKVPGVA